MGKTAVVTGGSRGIGKAIALRLAREGYDIAINYASNDEAAEAAKKEISEAGVRCEIYKADTSDIDQVKAMFKDIRKSFDTIDVLINNAGVVDDAYLLMIRQESLERSLAINIKGYINCAQAASLKMCSQRSGKIINVSSVSSILAVPGQTVYSATKGAVNSMTQTMAKELAQYGIQVNAVAPGFIGTDMIKSIPGDLAEKYLDAVPMKRFGTAEDVADCVASLLTDAFAYMTGQVIVLDGGLSL
ncbi:MAG: 3-oxoacyl-ACP reductase FabG [Lachnospiraceae bacterium]|nr:3-oxoacyl-ACP reductase FabG [Lachnospiraceae bacterium]